ncbi:MULTISPECIES: hypothetical protein [unclassified Bacillus (in: firmicutes)]|nr:MULTISPECIES: hypothetical protein [unclassified Bacillus (in: firmicutes)]
MENKNNFLDKRGDFTAPPAVAADYPKKPDQRKIEEGYNKRK